MTNIWGYGEVPDDLDRNDREDLERIMEQASQAGGWGAIPTGERKVRERLSEIRQEREKNSPRRRYND